MCRMLLLVVGILVLASGCSKPGSTANSKSSAPKMYYEENQGSEPNRISVQHCLISFKGVATKPTVVRSQAEAKQLAKSILERARAGEDFDALVKEFTDDSHPGIYIMVNRGLTGNANPMQAAGDQIYERDSMVGAFGDVGFQLEVDEIGMADFDKISSPYGFHIIKRLR